MLPKSTYNRMPWIFPLLWGLGWSLSSLPAFGKEDPFAGVVPQRSEKEEGTDFLTENFAFRKELMSEFGADSRGEVSSRQSVGFEVQKKFSSETSTLFSIDFQARLVRRDGFTDAPNDMEGMTRPGWSFEVHNAYLDLYNPLGGVGVLNLRAGRFYLPFGLNLATDTHGSLLQLSNEMGFGFERDWYAGFWGSLGDTNYDLYYLAGSGYDLLFKGQTGLGALRLSLGNRYASEDGMEGGFSFLGGRRLSMDGSGVETQRIGIDGRLRGAGPFGPMGWTTEMAVGRDEGQDLFTQLHQFDYLHASRSWGLSAQYRRSWEEAVADSSVSAEATWYLSNDVGGSNLQWLKLNVRWPLEVAGPTLFTLQYYQYW